MDTKTHWYLKLYPNGKTEDVKEFVSVFLILKTSDRNEVLAHFKLALIDGNQHIRQQMGIQLI